MYMPREEELTEGIIKIATGQFDVEILHSIQLQNIGFVTLGASLLRCANVTALDLSHNELTTLEGIQGTAPSLQWLDISCNAVTSLAPLECCKKLQVCRARGNRLSSFAPLCAKIHSELRSLYLQKHDFTEQNPVCADRAQYLAAVKLAFPNGIRCLDGHYFLQQEPNPTFVNMGNDEVFALPPSKPWVQPTLSGPLDPAKCGVMPERAFFNLATECKKLAATELAETKSAT